MTDDEKFFERLRVDARPLRRQPDEQTLARIRARIQERIAPKPTVVELLAAWFRPLAATAAAVALAAALGLTVVRYEPALGDSTLEVTTGGETYVVVD